MFHPPDPKMMPLETDAAFWLLSTECELALDLLVVENLPDFGGEAHTALTKRRMLFNLLITMLDSDEPLRQMLTSPDPQDTSEKTLYFYGLHLRAKKQGIDNIDGLCEMVGKDADSLYTYLYR